MEIMKKADMKDMSEFKIRNVASAKLRMDLSGPEYKKIVSHGIELFFLSMEEEPVAASPPTPPPQTSSATEEILEGEIERKPSIAAKNYDENGNPIVCKLSNKRKVTFEECKERTLVSARKYNLKDAEQFPSPKEMAPEVKRKIEETVMEILNKAESDDMSELNVQRLASEKLRMDLSGSECQQLVGRVIESFLISMEEEPITETAAAVEGETEESTEKGVDEYGNVIIRKLSSKREETVQDFEGKTLLPIKEYCQKDGKQFPSNREMKNTIEETVKEILKKAEMEDMSEVKVRSVAAEKLQMDLSGPEYQKIVSCVIESFFLSMEEEPVAASPRRSPPPQTSATEEIIEEGEIERTQYCCKRLESTT